MYDKELAIDLRFNAIKSENDPTAQKVSVAS